MARYIIGIDEAGRGPWAGPLVAAAVALQAGVALAGVRDSKRLTALSRSRLTHQIVRESHAVGIGWVTPLEIDAVGLQAATRAAMLAAYQQIDWCADADIIIDGSINYLNDEPTARSQVRADGSVPAVSAASIIAKHYRDRFMVSMGYIYPQYGFENHAGYGTAAHRQAIELYGVCDLHRRSFAPIKELLKRVPGEIATDTHGKARG